MILVPAYGRDYRTKDEALADFAADKDFRIASVPNIGKYCNRRDLLVSEEAQVKIRYSKTTAMSDYAKFTVVNVKTGIPT